jgi:hypothetical protein
MVKLIYVLSQCSIGKGVSTTKKKGIFILKKCYKKHEIWQTDESLSNRHFHLNCGCIVLIIPMSNNTDGDERVHEIDIKKPSIEIWRNKDLNLTSRLSS